MEPSPKKSKMSEETLDSVILNIWKHYENDLRTCKRNSEVYERMARATNERLTAQELSIKIRSLREKYRAEKIRMDAAKETSSKWIYFERVHQIIENKSHDNYSHTAPFSVSKIKQDPLIDTCTNELQIVDMPGFSPIPSPSSLSSENEATSSTKDKDFKKRKEWTEDDNAKLVNIWEKYAEALRKLKRNSHIYLRIAREMKKFNVQEVHTKINNFIQKYRKEKNEMEASGKPSSWVNYEQVERIMTNISNMKTSGSSTPFSITEVEYKLDLEFKELQNLKKEKIIGRNTWQHGDTLLLYDVWQKYESELRKTKRNSHVYEKMSEEMHGKYTAREIHTKINNQIQRYRKEKRDMEAAQTDNPQWPDYQRVHEILSGVPLANSVCQTQSNISDNKAENSNTAHFSNFSEQSQSNSLSFCQTIKVSSSPLPESAPKSPSSTISEHFMPETMLNTMSSADLPPLSTFSQQAEDKSDSLQAEILENIKKQTEIMQNLSEQSAKQTHLIEKLNNNFEKFMERQAACEKAYMDIFQKLLEK